mgnify:CR=1 FL=1
MSLPEDRDLIPGERPEEFLPHQSQVSPEAEQAATKQPILERPEKPIVKARPKQPAKPEKRSWQPFNLSKEPVRGERVANRDRFMTDLKQTLGRSWGDAETRGDVAAALRKASRGGLFKGETKKVLRRLERDDTISPTQKRILRRKLGAF